MSALASRIDPKGRRIGEFVKQEINNKLDTEFYIGIDDEFDINRVAKIVSFSKLSALAKMPFEFLEELSKPWSITFKSIQVL